MAADWAAAQRWRRQRKRTRTTRISSPKPGSDSALRSDKPRPLRHSRSLREGDLSRLRRFGSFDTALCLDVASADLDDQSGAGDVSGHEDMEENARPPTFGPRTRPTADRSKGGCSDTQEPPLGRTGPTIRGTTPRGPSRNSGIPSPGESNAQNIFRKDRRRRLIC